MVAISTPRHEDRPRVAQQWNRRFPIPRISFTDGGLLSQPHLYKAMSPARFCRELRDRAERRDEAFSGGYVCFGLCAQRQRLIDDHREWRTFNTDQCDDRCGRQFGALRVSEQIRTAV